MKRSLRARSVPPYRPLALTATAALALATVWPGAVAAGSSRKADGITRTGQPFEWSGRIERGKTLEIKGVNGHIRAELARGAEAEVGATRRGRRDDPDQVRIEVVEHAGGVTVCAVYPGWGNRCEPGRDGRMSAHDNDVSVDFTVRLPAGVGLDARLVNGGIEATALRGTIRASTVNGSIEFSTSEYGEASTVNGAIVAALERARWGDDLTFQTVNGSITLELPESVNAEVRAETMNGSISSDFGLTARTGFLHHRLDGTLGQGGRELRLKTLNGAIELRRTTGRAGAKGT